MHSADKILHAVTLLSEALQERDARELLLHHRQELQLAFDNLWGILRSSTSCNLPAVEPSDQNQNEDLPHHLPYQDQRVPLEAADVSHLARQLQQPVLSLSPQSEPSLPELGDDDNPTQEQKDTVALFMKKLDRVSKNIRKFLNQSEDDALLINNDWTTDDPRLVDIDLAERRLTPSIKLRSWLARYSFADDYLAWAAGHYNLPREHFLILQPEDTDTANRHSSPVTNYMSVINSEDQRIIRAIRHGLKYHSFHHIHGNFGAFAFLSQMFTAFRDVPYPCIKFLSDSIHGSSEWSGLSNKKATWISDCWAIYSTTVRYSRQVRSRKRPFGAENPNEQGQSKRQQFTSSSENTTETRSHLTHTELNSCQFQDDESLPRPNLPQDLRELQGILGNFDPITDLDSLGVDYTDRQKHPENTENLDRNDTTQSVPGFPQEAGQDYHEVFPFHALESLAQPIC